MVYAILHTTILIIIHTHTHTHFEHIAMQSENPHRAIHASFMHIHADT